MEVLEEQSTEIGTYPEGWSIDRVDSVFDLIQGKQVSERNRVGDNQRPFLRTKNVFWNRLELNELDRMHFSAAEEERYVLKPGDLLLCEGGDVGRTAMWQGEVERCYIQNHLHRLRAFDGMVDPQYGVFWFWYAFNVGNLYIGRGNKTTIPNMSRSKLAELPIALPPMAEQQRIAQVLSTVQAAIEQQERLIRTTTELKQALMQKLFTEGLRGEAQKETEIGAVPESWEVVEIGRYFQIKHGYAFEGTQFRSEGELVLMTPGHFFEEGGFRDQGDKTKYVVGDFPQEYLLAKDDLLVAMTEQKAGLLGSSAFVPQANRYLHNQRLGLVTELNTTRLSKRFLFHVFNTPRLRDEVAKTSTGSKVRHTSPTKLRAVKMAIPTTIEEQEVIANALNSTAQRIKDAERKQSLLQDLFRTLLHELMTGKVRVGELEQTGHA